MPDAVEGIMANEARPDSLSTTEARALALRAQGFGARSLPARAWGGPAPIDVLDLLGPSSGLGQRGGADAGPGAVRPPGPLLRPEMWRAVYAERRGFEYWGHAALPGCRWPSTATSGPGWPTSGSATGSTGRRTPPCWGRAGPHPGREARSARPLEDPRPERGTWWDWKPAKQALEVLFADGDLSCAGRTAGFARLYDLTERVLPAGLDTSLPDTQEAAAAPAAAGRSPPWAWPPSPKRPTTSGSPAPSGSP